MASEMVGPQSTTIEWQKHTGEIAVLPVGSFEQHGPYLPLDTDISGANYFATMLAEDIDAALMPALPYGTCLEHTGFRGSISLRPETLMATVRDIVDELERQNFRILIVLNGHGGNFSLAPAIRDMNRLDRPIKILLVNWWDYMDDEIAVDSRHLGIDLHAGEMETSFMLAIQPGQVRPEFADSPPLQIPGELNPADLNAFGMGHFARDGAVGSPCFATADKGHAIIASVRPKMLAHVRERIERLRTQSRYAGPGGIAIRELAMNDLEAAMRLTRYANWNQTESDWRFFLEQSPDGCFAAVHNGRVVGSVATIVYDNSIAWISMVLVEPQFRGAGIGSRLMHQALEYLRDIPTVRLDATPDGKQVYDKIGFNAEFGLLRLTHPSVPRLARHPDAIPLQSIEEVERSDSEAFGASRRALLERLRSDAPGLAWTVGSAGMCLGRPGNNFTQIGPVLAPEEEAGSAVVTSALCGLTGRPVVIDVPETRADFVDWLKSLGFTVQRPFTRMVLGEPRITAPRDQLYAICGPEFG